MAARNAILRRWRGVELQAGSFQRFRTLPFELEARGYGAVLATDSAPTTPIKTLLGRMKQRAPARLADLSHEWKVLPQRMVTIPSTRPALHAPEGMMPIPAERSA